MRGGERNAIGCDYRLDIAIHNRGEYCVFKAPDKDQFVNEPVLRTTELFILLCHFGPGIPTQRRNDQHFKIWAVSGNVYSAGKTISSPVRLFFTDHISR